MHSSVCICRLDPPNGSKLRLVHCVAPLTPHDIAEAEKAALSQKLDSVSEGDVEGGVEARAGSPFG